MKMIFISGLKTAGASRAMFELTGPGQRAKTEYSGCWFGFSRLASSCENVVISNSIVDDNTVLENIVIEGSIIGRDVTCTGRVEHLTLGDNTRVMS